MPQELRILQIADLLIENEKTARPIIQAIRDYRNGFKPDDYLDYLVICGNITKGGEKEHFDAALRVLSTVRDTLFDPTSLFPHNRVFIVPGARDIPELPGGVRDSEKYGEFYQKFYAGAPESFEQFDATGAIVRSLVDLTMIGICYYLDVADPDTAIATVMEALTAARSRAEEWQYLVAMPAILISSFPPLLSRDGSPRVRQTARYEDLLRQLPITIHLVGGPVTTIGKEPFQNSKHVTVGTGPVFPNQRWSGRLNVISIQPRDWGPQPEPGQERETVKVTAHKWPDTITGNEKPFPLFGGQRVPTKGNDVFVFDQIVTDLLGLLKENRAIVVTGMPGKGKTQVYNHCESLSPRFACEKLLEQTEWEEILARLRAELERNREAPPIVVIHDNAPRREPSRAQISEGDGIVDSLKGIAALKVRSIYLFPYAVRRPKLPPGFGFYDLPSLEQKRMEALAYWYSSRLPIKKKHLLQLSGGYLGFTLLLLEQAKKIIEKTWPGARPIEVDTSWTLILESLSSSNELDEVTDRFFAVLSDEAGGSDLAHFLMLQFSARLAAYGKTERLLDPMVFTLEDIVSSQAADSNFPPHPKDIQVAAGNLVKAQLLSQQGNGSYRLLELTPFLVRALTSVNVSDAADNPAANGRTFISYSRRDLEQVRPIVEQLRKAGFNVWWDQDMIAGVQWTTILEQQLKDSACILVFLTKSAWDDNSFVKPEALFSLHKVVPVKLQEMDVPLPFLATQCLSMIGWDGKPSAPQWTGLIKAVVQKVQSVPTPAA